ncbi:ABC transporter permease [Bifidobacterium olomucense]|uniref:Peptide ABC transporter permease n=1 Tax=Bifidobacterium olomucense TaxID=2675324 RepID=A0A7Y0HX66_9BIFI|nr:ABC transporter permease [Bifidobacterium sp. DSM 109959]NMM98403.1 peptide ABC transporter permease [Bifidobacterium sp. DSM 109959]
MKQPDTIAIPLKVQRVGQRTKTATLSFPRHSRILDAFVGNFRQPSLAIAVAVLLLVLGWAIKPSLFTRFDPIQGDAAERLAAPSARHLFGTDQLGRDVLSRMIYGAGESVRAALLAIAIALVVGSLLGLIAGLSGSVVDSIIMRVVDILLSIPALLLSIVVVTALGFGTTKVAIAVGISGIGEFARVMRSSVLSIASRKYIESSYGLGLGHAHVAFTHVLPNALSAVLALASISFGNVILQIASLSFLGYGNPLPAPEWGSIIADGRNYLVSGWWLIVLPGLVVIAVVLSANRLGHAWND